MLYANKVQLFGTMVLDPLCVEFLKIHKRWNYSLKQVDECDRLIYVHLNLALPRM